VGLVFVAVAGARGTIVREHRFAGDRAAIQALAAEAACELLADHLAGLLD
jgi:nicotinamide mononucleotide (NMN) deamidase PncC